MEHKFESSVRHIGASRKQVYDMLSNLENIGRVVDRIPEKQRDNLSFDRDSVSIGGLPVGGVTVRIVGRDEPATIKMQAEQSPVPFFFWVQLLPEGDDQCKMRLTMKAELNPFIAQMAKKPLQEGIDKIADALEQINYTV